MGDPNDLSFWQEALAWHGLKTEALVSVNPGEPQGVGTATVRAEGQIDPFRVQFTFTQDPPEVMG